MIILTLISEESSRHLNLLASHNNNLLAFKNLFADNASETSEQMSLSVNNEGLGVRFTLVDFWQDFFPVLIVFEN